MTDVTDRREAEHRLQHDALHDALTGLPNRVLFVDRLDQAIRRAQRHHPECCAAVLFLDLDRFKVINDSLGHQRRRPAAEGGRAPAASRRCARTTPSRGSAATSSRCCSTTSATPREATVIAERVLHSLQAPFELDGRELFIGASIGIALADRRRPRPSR